MEIRLAELKKASAELNELPINEQINQRLSVLSKSP